jgi:hypothetical protein
VMTSYEVDETWNPDEIYVIAWVSDPETKEIYNSGTRFDADFTSATNPVQPLAVLSIYPNPASNEINIKLPSEAASAAIEVVDLQGRVVRSLPSQIGPILQVNITDLPTGNYFVRLKAEKQMYTGSFEILR